MPVVRRPARLVRSALGLPVVPLPRRRVRAPVPPQAPVRGPAAEVLGERWAVNAAVRRASARARPERRLVLAPLRQAARRERGRAQAVLERLSDGAAVHPRPETVPPVAGH